MPAVNSVRADEGKRRKTLQVGECGFLETCKVETRAMSIPSHLYPIPRERLDGRSAEMAFADVIYYFAATRGRAAPDVREAYIMEVNFNQLSAWSGLDTSTINEEADNAMKAGWLKRTSIGNRDEEQMYMLNYASLLKGGATLKPMPYVQNGWLRTVYRLSRSYILQRLLNVVWLMHFGSEPREISLEELRQRTTPDDAARPLARTRLITEIDKLEKLGVLTISEDKYQLDRECFNAPAPDPESVEKRWDRTRLIGTALYGELKATDAKRAARALDVLLVGRFDPDKDFKSIFDDLRFVGNDFDLLLTLARRRPKNNGQPAWQGLWRNFIKRRDERSESQARLHSSTTVFDFGQAQKQSGLLGFTEHSADKVQTLWVYARLRGEFNARQQMKDKPEVRFHLASGDTELANAMLNLGEKTKQEINLSALGRHAPLYFSLIAYAPKTYKGIRLEVWLEGEGH